MRAIGLSDPNRALGPKEAADRTFAAHQHDSDWLDAFTECADRLRGGASFARTIDVWGLSQAEAARLFGGSRQTVGRGSDKARAVRPRGRDGGPVRPHRSAGAPFRT